MTTLVDAKPITKAELLTHWQGHRSLTRKLIAAFPEQEFFSYSIGGMRPCSALIKEVLTMAVPGLRQIATHSQEAFKEDEVQFTTKAEALALWDAATPELTRLWALIPEERFHENILMFGQYQGTVWWSIFYFIDNEIHHRAQAYVYLRSLGIEPPAFWDR
jgi:uncharacterized damage-inducible protein DinB